MRRTKIEIYKEILTVSKKGATATQIVYGCNLNFKIYKGYVWFLIERGLLVLEKIGKRGYYTITEKGMKELNIMNTLSVF